MLASTRIQTAWPNVPQCGCETWSTAAGTVSPLFLDWSDWLDSAPGYSLGPVASVGLIDLRTAPPSPPPDDDIALVSGFEPPPSSGPPGWTQVVGDQTINLIYVGPHVAPGSIYRLDFVMKATDPCGRQIVTEKCVAISVAARP